MKFKDKVVVVTGASRGLGRSTAVLFAKEGANVVINYKNSKVEVESLKDILEAYGVSVMVVQVDVSKETDVQRVVEEVISNFGRVDILVNNAEIAIDADFKEEIEELNGKEAYEKIKVLLQNIERLNGLINKLSGQLNVLPNGLINKLYGQLNVLPNDSVSNDGEKALKKVTDK